MLSISKILAAARIRQFSYPSSMKTVFWLTWSLSLHKAVVEDLSGFQYVGMAPLPPLEKSLINQHSLLSGSGLSSKKFLKL